MAFGSTLLGRPLGGEEALLNDLQKGRRLDQALGHAAEPFDALMPPEVIRRRLAFAESIASREALCDAVASSVTISAVTSLQKSSGFAGSTSCSDVSIARPKPCR